MPKINNFWAPDVKFLVSVTVCNDAKFSSPIYDDNDFIICSGSLLIDHLMLLYILMPFL